MNKLFKNVIALFVMAIAAIMIIPNVFAQITATTGDITVKGIKEDATTISYYKVIDVHFDTDKQQPTEPVYTWNTEVGKWIFSQDKYKKYVNRTGTEGSYVYEVTEEFNSKKSNSKEIAAFYKDLEEAIKSTGEDKINISAVKTTSVATKPSSGAHTESGMDMGGYLVTLTSANYQYNPSAANVFPKYYNEEGKKGWFVENGTAVVKSETNKIDKKVNDSDIIQTFIGKVLDFTIDADIPNFPTDYDTKTITITDTFQPGITFKEGSIKVYGVIGANVDANRTLLAISTEELKNFYRVTASSNGGFTIEIDADEYKKLQDNGYEMLHIEYKGTVNTDANIKLSNDNTASMTYGDDHTVISDTVKVYTYGVKIHKFKKVKENDTDVYSALKDAIFQITDVDGKVLGTSHKGEVLKFTTKTVDGKVVYVLASFTYTDNDPTKAVVWENGADANVTVLSDDGIAEIRGLAEGKYKVEETKAPDGYVKLQQPYEITIADTKCNTDKLCGEVSDPARLVPNAEAYTPVDGYVDQDVINSEGFELPVTGGIGTLLFSVLGIVFMGVAAFLIKSIFSGKKVENN